MYQQMYRLSNEPRSKVLMLVIDKLMKGFVVKSAVGQGFRVAYDAIRKKYMSIQLFAIDAPHSARYLCNKHLRRT